MGSISHNGNFFSIYVFSILIFFHIFYHIEILLFIHYISPFFMSSRNYILSQSLHTNKACIFHYGTIKDINEYNKFLFFFDIVFHRNVARDLDRVMDF